MKTALRSGIGAAVALLVALGGLPATAGTAADPEITDQEGDANGTHQVLPDPGSIGGADLLAAWYQTLYTTAKEVDAEGQVIRVRHVPHTLKVSIETAAPASPAFGPTVILEVPVKLDACRASVSVYIRGPQSLPGDPQGAFLSMAAASCPKSAPSPGLTLPAPSFPGNLTTVLVPFSTTDGALRAGTVITASGASSVLAMAKASTSATGGVNPLLDLANSAKPFTVGQDVPADVECAAQPTYPGCSA